MTRRVVEPTPAWVRCEWLDKRHGAKLIKQHWSAYGLWCCNVPDLPEPDCQHPCDGCPIVLSEGRWPRDPIRVRPAA